MNTVVGPLQLTVHGRHMVAESMYVKGKAFLGAAILLRQKGVRVCCSSSSMPRNSRVLRRMSTLLRLVERKGLISG